MVSLSASLIIMSAYSCLWASVMSLFLSCRAKPRMDTMGVLNSCENELMKSLRKSSVLPSSSAIMLKLFVSSSSSFLTPFISSTRTEKSPFATRRTAPMICFIGRKYHRVSSAFMPVPTATHMPSAITGHTTAGYFTSGSAPRNSSSSITVTVSAAVESITRKVAKTICAPSFFIASSPPCSQARVPLQVLCPRCPSAFRAAGLCARQPCARPCRSPCPIFRP